MIYNARNSSIGLLAIFAVVSALTFWETTIYAQQLQAEPYEGVLVLRNGQVFRGQITRAGDRYVVALGTGQISVKSSEVEVCCQSLEEAYRLRKQYNPCHSAFEHLKLAQWCQQQGLLDKAAEELANAAKLDPLHPMIPLLERRLQTLREGVERREPIAQLSQGQRPDLDLDRIVRSMPAGTMESFTQTIQPMLINNCTTSGCHGPGSSSSFSLTRVSPGALAGRRATQRNLQTVLQWIDRDNPQASPLLASPLRAHGTAKGPIFTDRQAAQFEQLVNWVYRVSQVQGRETAVMQASHVENDKPTHQVSPAMLTTPAGQVLSGAKTLGDAQPQAPAVATELEPALPMGVETPADANPSEPATSRFDRPGIKRGTLPKEFTPADPFDPEVFNRQFFPGESRPKDGEPKQ